MGTRLRACYVGKCLHLCIEGFGLDGLIAATRDDALSRLDSLRLLVFQGILTSREEDQVEVMTSIPVASS